MNQTLKKGLSVGLAALMIAGVGAGYTNGVQASAKSKVSCLLNHWHHVKAVKRHRRTRRQSIRRKRVNHYNHKVRKANRRKKMPRGQRVLKSQFKRSNDLKALKRSGFFDAHMIGGNFIFDKYAPNDKRAVVPERMNVDNWYKGKFGQKNPTAYHYVPKSHGWKLIK